MPNPPSRKGKTNDLVRPGGEHLTPRQVELIAKAAATAGRHGFRDSQLILVIFRHAFRVSELTALKREQLDLDAGEIRVRRLKRGKPATHVLGGEEIRALRRLYRDYSDSPYVFSTERRGPMTASTVQKIVARAGEKAKIPFPIHPHMLRHACGYKLANEGHDLRSIQDYMGHRNIQQTVRYTELSPTKFKDFWKD